MNIIKEYEHINQSKLVKKMKTVMPNLTAMSGNNKESVQKEKENQQIL